MRSVTADLSQIYLYTKRACRHKTVFIAVGIFLYLCYQANVILKRFILHAVTITVICGGILQATIEFSFQSCQCCLAETLRSFEDFFHIST